MKQLQRVAITATAMILRQSWPPREKRKLIKFSGKSREMLFRLSLTSVLVFSCSSATFGDVITYLNFPGAPPFSTSVGAINNNGDIAGGYALNGFLYSAGIWTSFAYPGAVYTNVRGINDSGQIVGGYFNYFGPYGCCGVMGGGFLYSGGAFQSITYPGAVLTGASDINDQGQIVGAYSGISQVSQGFLYSGGVFSTIDYPGALQTFLGGINNSGQIVGDANNGIAGQGLGFLYFGGTFVPLNYPGASSTAPTAINNLGEIAGFYLDSSMMAHGFLEKGGIFSPFDIPGAAETVLYGINDTGEIVGLAINSDHFARAFVDTPGVPEPSSIILLSSVAVLLAMVRCLRAGLKSRAKSVPFRPVGANGTNGNGYELFSTTANAAGLAFSSCISGPEISRVAPL